MNSHQRTFLVPFGLRNTAATRSAAFVDQSAAFPGAVTKGPYAGRNARLKFISGPLTRRRRLSATARVLRWQIASRIHDEVIVDWIAGTRFAARRGMTGVTGNIYAGLHECARTSVLKTIGLRSLSPH